MGRSETGTSLGGYPSLPVSSRIFIRNTFLNFVNKGFFILSGDNHRGFFHLNLLIRWAILMGFLLLSHTCICGKNTAWSKYQFFNVVLVSVDLI